jgi:formate dehydrogenase maturation protein FdhE
MENEKKGRPVVKDYGFLEDEYVQRWLAGLAAKSQVNYRKQFGEVLDFLQMTPKEMIEKRVKDLMSQDLSERQFFEVKFRGFKARLEETKQLSSAKDQGTLRIVFKKAREKLAQMYRNRWNASPPYGWDKGFTGMGREFYINSP